MTIWTKKSGKGWQEWYKLVGIVVYLPTSWKHPWKQGLLVNSSFSKRLWNLWMTSIFVIAIQAFNCIQDTIWEDMGNGQSSNENIYLNQWWNNVHLIKFEGFGSS
jgi:hypothetical protein